MTKITSLELEDVKRIRCVALEPSENGLTIIGGRNEQGKTSVLDAIAWALGGDKFRPSAAVREGSTVPPHLKIKLSNGLTVERSGKNSDLKVIDETGKRGGQTLLNAFISTFALDLPRFMESSSKDKADVLLKIIGAEKRLKELDDLESKLYNRRLETGRIAEQKAKFAAEMPYHADAPQEPVSVSELIARQQDILARNGINEEKRRNAAALRAKEQQQQQRLIMLNQQMQALKNQYDELYAEYAVVQQDADMAEMLADDLMDESTEELEASIRNVEEINRRVRDNIRKAEATTEAEHYKQEYDGLSDQIEQVRKDRKALLDSAELPLPGLSVEGGELIYKGQKWDCMSSSEQLRTATAIVRKLNPECGFVLVDKLEQMDTETLREFGQWLESEGLQVIGTRVSTGGECSIIISDGCIIDEKPAQWQTGVF